MSTRQAAIPLNSLYVSGLNTRRDLTAGQEDSGIDELAASIREKGLIQPITVRPAEAGRFEVVVGQRRFLACQKIGFDPIPCLVRDDLDDADALSISLVENIHRADMNPLDKARALKSLFERHGSYQKVASETSWSPTTVKRYISLLDLPPAIQDKLTTSDGSAGVGALSRLATIFPGDQAADVFNKISGFKPGIQEEILKRSGGDPTKLEALVAEAMEGAFEVRRCGGRVQCEIVKDILEGSLTMSAFADLVRADAQAVGSDVGRGALKDAARVFWKALASSY